MALHASAWLLGLSVLRVGLIPPQNCQPVDAAQLDTAITRTATWAVDNLTTDGAFLYRYDRTTGTDLGGYNLVRHAGMTNALYQLAVAGDDRFTAGADASLDFLLDRSTPTESGVAIGYSGQRAKLGTSALTAAALVHRRQATGDTTYDGVAVQLGHFLVGQIEANGAPANFWNPETGAPVSGVYGLFATGEAAWALALLDQIAPAEGFRDAALDIVHYVATERRDHEDLLLRAPDHWTAYAMAELGVATVGADAERATYVDRLAGDFALMSRVEPTRRLSGVQSVLRFDQALGAGVGAMGEGLVSLHRYRADAGVEDDADALAERVECTVHTLVDRQVGPDDVQSDPGSEIGAWFTDDVTQVDDQQHTLSTLLLGRDILFPTVSGDDR